MTEWQKALAVWNTIMHIYSVSLPNLVIDITRAGSF
jgi:hypothetical protein